MSDLLESQAKLLTPTAGRFAEVRVGGDVTRYVRRGTGSPVVVLHASSCADAIWPELIDRLAIGHRVIVPEVSGPDGLFASWIRGFLEGIGASSVALIAAGPYCVPALELGLLGTDSLSRLVLVPEGFAGETGLSGALASGECDGPTGLPVLVVRREHPAPEAVALIHRFVPA